MNIKYQTEGLSKKEVYKMTKDSGILSMKDIESGAEVEVKGYLVFTDTNSKGEEAEVLSILTSSGDVWSTTSPTFKNAFHEIVEIMDGEPFKIRKIDGVSKAGRKFVNCALI